MENMKKCPHCGQAFTVDDTELSSIVKQIRDKEFEKDLTRRTEELAKHLQEKHALELSSIEDRVVLKTRQQYEEEINKLRDEKSKEIEKLKEEDLDFLCESAAADACAPGNPRPASLEEFREMFKKLM